MSGHDPRTIEEVASIGAAFEKLNVNKLGILFTLDSDMRVAGVITDGDIRRQLLKDPSLDAPIHTFANRDFVSAHWDAPREYVLKLLDHRIQVVPILDAEGRLIDVFTRDRFAAEREREVLARARAPVRISFSGGGTDLTYHFMKNGGAVVNATIQMYAHATLRKRLDWGVRIYSHDFRRTIEAKSLDSLPEDSEFRLLASVIKLVAPDYGFDLEVSTDFPVGSGLGGSAVVAAAVIGCFNEFRSDHWDRHEIAEMAFQAERLMLNIPGGWQDQYATVFGGFNYIEFAAEQNLVIPLRLDRNIVAELEESLVLCYTGSTHDSGSIHVSQKERILSDEAVASAARDQMRLTREMKHNLLRGRLRECGALLDAGWQAKRRFSPLVSSEALDAIYDHAMSNGALGGKLLGAGGGGYFLFFVKPLSRYAFVDAMERKGLSCTRICFESDGLRSWKSRIEP